jgi:hypothetical protein
VLYFNTLAAGARPDARVIFFMKFTARTQDAKRAMRVPNPIDYLLHLFEDLFEFSNQAWIDLKDTGDGFRKRFAGAADCIHLLLASPKIPDRASSP